MSIISSLAASCSRASPCLIYLAYMEFASSVIVRATARAYESSPILRYKPATVAVTSELPLGSGLGSSASFCVSLAAALLAITSEVSVDDANSQWLTLTESNLELLNKWAFEGEKIIHGKPSGIDNTSRYKPATVAVTSELPLGVGLGSSSSFCVSLAATLLALTSEVSVDDGNSQWLTLTESNLELVNKWAFEGEKIIHGKPSGIDNTVSTFGISP
ncbi:Mevalonate kinase [Platanthera guangdongensis]|uniref:mevalonate kinase n=1 Tax=Platanthera guangdongensis TaxID=2320717 RepID=A0ABR2M8D8_9ASPA